MPKITFKKVLLRKFLYYSLFILFELANFKVLEPRYAKILVEVLEKITGLSRV